MVQKEVKNLCICIMFNRAAPAKKVKLLDKVITNNADVIRKIVNHIRSRWVTIGEMLVVTMSLSPDSSPCMFFFSKLCDQGVHYSFV